MSFESCLVDITQHELKLEIRFNLKKGKINGWKTTTSSNVIL